MSGTLEMIAPAETATVVRCPSCGNDGTAGPIRYLADIRGVADVVALRGRVLELAGPPSRSLEVPPERRRFECLGAVLDSTLICGHRWPVPDRITGLFWRVPP